MQESPVETTLYSLAASAPSRPERRESERYLSLLRVGAMVVDGRRELCLIRNISAGGMMIRAYSDIPVGTPLSIELKQGDPVSGVIQWVDGGLTGVTFDAPIDVLALLAPPGDGPRPRLPRIEVDCTAWVRQESHVVRTRAANVSQGGIRVESPAAFVVGGDVVVTLPGLTPAAGVVRWRDGDAYGIAFNRALILSELVHWLQDQQQDQQKRAAVG
ncbi:MAG: PilZ domain-containing protein [Bacillota bacterium]